ncbi:hypothetical protein BT93_E1720 [Corymbia citriodora subsp. variegata]|nr:hypothetical protein BT93_E1720 [Corymbia citriodora subsp. variegata]
MAGAGTTPASDDHLKELANSIRSKFEGLSLPSDCCIFTVPERLWRTNEEAYTPRVIAIGPYHRLNPSLKRGEDHKLLYLQNFFQHNNNYRLEDYIQKVKSWEEDARNCYDKQIKLDSGKFAEMMLLDGIFVIQLFLMNLESWRRLPNDQIFGKPWMLGDVCRDMSLLENQIPFFVIQQLFEMAFGTHQQLPELVSSFFGPVMGKEKLPELAMDSKVKHFVHLISLSFSPSATELGKEQNESDKEMKFTPSATELGKEQNENDKEMKFTPSATELVSAGVKLVGVESTCLFNIEFKNGVLNIPYLALYDTTESNFRNIMAFEQCYWENRYLTDYMDFMHHLVDTVADAELLINNEIIENWLSNKEAVARVINALGKENELSINYYFSSLSDELIKHCKKRHNKWKATLKREHCSNPWVIISVIAAAVLLVLTIAQTVLSALSLG